MQPNAGTTRALPKLKFERTKDQLLIGDHRITKRVGAAAVSHFSESSGSFISEAISTPKHRTLGDWQHDEDFLKKARNMSQPARNQRFHEVMGPYRSIII